MIAFLLSPVYILANIYVIFRGLKWMGACNGFFSRRWFKIAFALVYSVIASSLVTGFFLPASGLQRIARMTGNIWLGVFLYIFMFMAIADIIKTILKHSSGRPKAWFTRKGFVIIGGIVAACIIGMSMYGVINAGIIRVAEYDVSIEKSVPSGDLNIVLVADIHMGYSIGSRFVERMVDKINSLDPDIVCIAGDIFNNEYDALDDPDAITSLLAGIKSRYGTYACYGNHDISEQILAGFTFDYGGVKLSDPRMDEMLENAGIILLRDEPVLVNDEFYVIGRRDEHRPGNEDNSRLSPGELMKGIDNSKPVIMIDHEPKGLSEIAQSGVDLDLSGHTHAGQVFPVNIIVGITSENSWGHKTIGNMHSIVTSGVGFFGPSMRTFTDSEVVRIHVDFN